MMNQLILKNQRMNDDVRVHRVGSITLGFVLIVFGILFLLHMAFPLISYQFIFRLWPTILISLGVEVLAANLWEAKEMRYDKGAVFLLITMTFFTMCIAGMEFMVEQMTWNIHF